MRRSGVALARIVAVISGCCLLTTCAVFVDGSTLEYVDGPTAQEVVDGVAADGGECGEVVDLTTTGPRNDRADPMWSAECEIDGVGVLVYEFAERLPAQTASSVMAGFGCWSLPGNPAWVREHQLILVAYRIEDDADADAVLEAATEGVEGDTEVATCEGWFDLDDNDAAALDEALEAADDLFTELGKFTTTTMPPSALVTEDVALRRDAVVHDWGDTVELYGVSVTVGNPRVGGFGEPWLAVDVRIENRSGELLDEVLKPRLVCAGSTDGGGLRVIDDTDLASDPIPDGAFSEGQVRMSPPYGDGAFDAPLPPCDGPAVARLLYPDGSSDDIPHDFVVSDTLLAELNAW